MFTNSRKLKCLIIDDEPLAQQVLAVHIAKIPSLELVQQCNNAMEAFEALHKFSVDLIFLDINMPVVSGLNFLRSLKDPPAVILTTAYTDYAMDGYDLDVVDYLLKPISFDRFSKAVAKVAAKLNAGNLKNAPVPEEEPLVAKPVSNVVKDYFFIKSDGKLVKINHADIRYIEGMKDYLKIHTGSQTTICHHTMKAMEELLPSGKFMRVHKSYIIALNAIKSIAGNVIYLDMERVEVPLGSSYRDALLEVVS